jgi:transposase
LLPDSFKESTFFAWVRRCKDKIAVIIEAIGPMRWFLKLLDELGIECRIGDATKIRAAEPRKQKHDSTVKLAAGTARTPSL